MGGHDVLDYLMNAKLGWESAVSCERDSEGVGPNDTLNRAR